jgi:hypothetical protein
VVAGVLLLGTGFICELVIRGKKPIIESFFVELFWRASLIWIELAVGILDTLAGS